MLMSRYLINPNARSDPDYSGLFEAEEYHLINDFFSAMPEFEPTPLVHLRGLASDLGIGDVLIKDESARLGLNSFKVLGVSYAVSRLLAEDRLADDAVLVCASEGNHGKATAS